MAATPKKHRDMGCEYYYRLTVVSYLTMVVKMLAEHLSFYGSRTPIILIIFLKLLLRLNIQKCTSMSIDC